ncbi:condensation domain-containing protein [Amycolatopsis sp. cmx-11-51]|uniref:condensation domain-containing protein n=1 Tax=Amycolatopsis sp. cmx-11-51 TaxID=2785797 RepID=UPI0039E3ED1D
MVESEITLPDGSWPLPSETTRLRPIDTGAVLVCGDLNVADLQRAVDALVVRQSALRTNIRLLPDSTPIQLVAHPRSHRVLCSTRTIAHEVPHRLPDIARRASEGVVDPRRDQLFRVHVLRLSEREHLLLLQIHHMISDGWSISVLYRELSALYTAATTGADAGLPALPFSFAAVCRQMRTERGSQMAQQQLRFWHACLAPPLSPIRFTDGPTTTYTGMSVVDTEPVNISRAVVRALRTTAQASNTRGGVAGPFLAALAVVLHARTEAHDIRIGMMIANRARPDTEHLIGYFVNTVVIRLHIHPDLTAAELVSAANAAVTEAIEHQTLPIQDLRRELPDPNAPYQVTVALNTMRTSSLELSGLDCQDVQPHTMERRQAPTTVEQRWVLEERAGALSGTLTYQVPSFTRTRILGYLADLDRAMSAVTEPTVLVRDMLYRDVR